jgi:hypothetical protein
MCAKIRLNIWGWWLLANSLEREDQKIKALERVLRLKPDHAEAKTMLNQLQGMPPEDDFDFEDSAPSGNSSAYASVAPKAKNTAVQKKGNANGTILFVVGAALVAVLLICGGISLAVSRGVNDISNTLISSITVMPSSGVSGVSSGNGASINSAHSTLISRGNLTLGQSQTASVDTFDDDEWRFSGNAGQSVTFTVEERDGSLDPQLYLYNSEGDF